MFQHGHDPLKEQINEITMLVLVIVFGKKIKRNKSGVEKCYVGVGLQPARQMNSKWA